MAKKKLDQYKGALSASEIAEGINAAIQNAVRLLEDAQILLKNKRFPSAASLATLSIEESGKISILRALSVARNDKDIKESWKEYRTHTKKNTQWIVTDLVQSGAKKLEDFRPMFEDEAEHPHILDQIKQLGFYTDCLGNKHWSIPPEIVDEALATMLVGIASILCSKKTVTEKEIELWIKHIGPVWKQDMNWMQKSLENWYLEMQDCGLVPEGENAMKKFIEGNIDFGEKT
ncbi:MAG: AbiV family abortive infection protein [Proteobacteria bacterium]|nr:AbiV family abortive infection protein [Pseudomonadota bacterium]